MYTEYSYYRLHKIPIDSMRPLTSHCQSQWVALTHSLTVTHCHSLSLTVTHCDVE